MLASAETIGVVADALRRHGKPVTVIDPVGAAFSFLAQISQSTFGWVEAMQVHLDTA